MLGLRKGLRQLFDAVDYDGTGLGDGNPYDEIYKLWDDNDDLLHNSLVSDYLKKENELSELVKKMVGTITDGLTNIME